MNSFIRLLQRFSYIILFAVLLSVSLSMYINTSYYQKAKIGAATGVFTGFFSEKFHSLQSYMNIRRDNVKLSLENVELRNEVERLKEALGKCSDSAGYILADTGTILIRAMVVNNSVSHRQNYITINIGRNNGAYPGMGVICNDGVVGVIAATSPNYSTVISLLNTNLRVSAKHAKSGVFGSLSWGGNSYREVELSDIPLHVNIAVGDTISTSGFSSIFPKDVPIGVIKDFYKKDGSFYSIRVQLLADFRALNYVYAVKVKDISEINQIEGNR
jgi:rod shape-determining protein MreC